MDGNALNRLADRSGSGRVAVEKDFVISVILMLISKLPGVLPLFRQNGLQRRDLYQEGFLP